MARRRAFALALVVSLLVPVAPLGANPVAPPAVQAREPQKPKPIPPAPEPTRGKPNPAFDRQRDLSLPPLPKAPDLRGLRGEPLFKAIASQQELAKPRLVTHKRPRKGDDPRDPAVVRTSNGGSLLLFLDDAGNLYQQANPGTALEPFWQSGNVIVSGPVDHPDVVRRDSGGTTTLGLFYLKTVASVTQVMVRTSTTDGQSWAAEAQVTAEATNVYWLRVLNTNGTIYLFWSDNDLTGKLYYRTTTDFSTWTAKTEVGRLIGPTTQNSMSSFDMLRLANGNWLLAWMDKRTDCSVGGCNDYNFPSVYTATSSDLSTWGAPVRHTEQVDQRWPRAFSLNQDSAGFTFLTYDRYEYPSGRYVRLRIGDSSGANWGTEITFGCDPGVHTGCTGGFGAPDIQAENPYLFLDEQQPGHMQALWQMNGGASIADPYPVQLFLADLTAAIYYRPLPPYMDPAVNLGLGSLGDAHVNLGSGNLSWAETDYELGGVGPKTSVARTYNSGDLRDGPFGFGWSFPYAMGLQVNADTSVTVHNFDGRRDYYTWNGTSYVAPPGTETTLVNEGIGGWTLTYKDHSRKTFDVDGHLFRIWDVDNNKTELTYTGGRLATITDAAQRVFTFGYNGDGRVSSVSLPLNRSISYGYDASGNLTSFTDPLGNVTAYTYVSDHRLDSVTDATGRKTTIGYTSLRRAKTITDPLGGVTTYRYTSSGASGGTTTVTDARSTQTIHTFDARHRQTQIEVVLPGSGNNLVTTMAYNSDDQLTSQTDPRGTVTAFTYDGHGNISQKVEDSGTGKLNLTWGYVYVNDDLTQSTDPRGAVTNYVYDAEHHLSSRTLHLAAEDLVWSFTYTAAGLLETTKDPKGQATGKVETNTYDNFGYLQTRTDAAMQLERFTYDAGGRMLNGTDKRTKVWTYTYDNNDQKLSETDPLTHAKTYTYSKTGELASVTDARGVVATSVYQRDGELVVDSRDAGSTGFRVTNPGFEFGATDWTASGTPSVVTTPVLTGTKAARVDSVGFYSRELSVLAAKRYGVTAYAMASAAGQTARLAYEWRASDHSLISGANVDLAVSTTGYLPLYLAPAVAPAGAAFLYLAVKSTVSGAFVYFDDVVPTYSTVTDYDATASRTSILDANGHVTRFGYDQASRVTSVTDARGKTATATLDKTGNVTRVTDALGHLTDFLYDAIDRQTRRTVDPAGLALVWNRALDGVGNVLTATDPDNRTTTFEYDKADRLTKVTDAKNGVTTYGYDKNGNRTSVTNARLKTSSAIYDDINQLKQTTDPLNRATNYTYDPNGNLASRLDAKNQLTSYVADDANRLSTVTYPSSSVSYTYDNADRLATMVDPHGTTTWTYDDLGRPTQIAQPTVGSVSYGYDRTVNRTSLSLPGKAVTYAYNEVDKIGSVTDWASRTATYNYDDLERLTGITFPTTVATAYTYDNANRTTNVAYTKSGAPLVNFAYTLNGSGQRLTEVGPEGTTGYTYDELHRITQVNYPDAKIETFGYDAIGNRTTKTLAGTTTYTYDNADQLTSEKIGNKTNTYTYDANGNRATKVVGNTTTTYTYDIENRLTKAQQGNTVQGEYFYDGWSNRYAKKIGATTTTYTLDLGARLTQVLAETGGVTYLNGGGPLAIDRSGTTSWYLTDGLGSVRRVTTGTGTIIASYIYEAFGALKSSTGTLVNDVRYSGERNDAETNLIFLRARHYDPTLGRFLQADRWPFDDRSSQDLNRYAYVRNDPANAIDPTGHDGFNFNFDLGAAVSNTVNFVASTVYDATIGTAKRIVDKTVAFIRRPSLRTALDLGGEVAITVASYAVGGIVGRAVGRLAAPWIARGVGALTGAIRGAARVSANGFIYAVRAAAPLASKVANVAIGLPRAVAARVGVAPLKAEAEQLSTLVYRGGSRSPTNLTPRPGVDVGGLSTQDTLEAAVGPGGKAQIIDTSRLRCLIACPDSPPGHVSLRPPDASQIPDWAATRGTGQTHPFTQDVIDAIVGVATRPK